MSKELARPLLIVSDLWRNGDVGDVLLAVADSFLTGPVDADAPEVMAAVGAFGQIEQRLAVGRKARIFDVAGYHELRIFGPRDTDLVQALAFTVGRVRLIPEFEVELVTVGREEWVGGPGEMMRQSLNQRGPLRVEPQMLKEGR